MAEGAAAAASEPAPTLSGSPTVRVLALGLVAGLLAGMFGVGGGIVMVPLLVAWFGLDQRRASATSLLAIVPIGVAAALGYGANGNVAFGAAALLVVGGVAGGQLGAWLLPRTPIPRLQLWFGILSLLTAVRLLIGEPGAEVSGSVIAAGPLDAILLVGVGVAGGLLAGLLGVGGGIIMVPALVILVGADADLARGTSLAVLAVTAVTASIANHRHRLVEVRTALEAGLAGVPGAVAGALVGQWLAGRVALGLFAGLLVWSGARMIHGSRRKARTPAAAPGA